jgi:hypothetical protein
MSTEEKCHVGTKTKETRKRSLKSRLTFWLPNVKKKSRCYVILSTLKNPDSQNLDFKIDDNVEITALSNLHNLHN